MISFSHLKVRVAGQGGPNFFLPVPFYPSSSPIFVCFVVLLLLFFVFLFFFFPALFFRLQNVTQCCVISGFS